MALWAVYYLFYPENYLELIPNIVCMFALGVCSGIFSICTPRGLNAIDGGHV